VGSSTAEGSEGSGAGGGGGASSGSSSFLRFAERLIFVTVTENTVAVGEAPPGRTTTMRVLPLVMPTSPASSPLALCSGISMRRASTASASAPSVAGVLSSSRHQRNDTCREPPPPPPHSRARS
jgi:hypothetical protein